MFTDGVNTGLQMSGIVVNVKYNVSSSFPVEVTTECDVLFVKEEISKRIKVPKEEIQLIFAGCVLKNESLLKVHTLKLPDPSPCSTASFHLFKFYKGIIERGIYIYIAYKKD